MADLDWLSTLARFGRHLHAAAGDDHHVVSALGAWMVVALCGGLAESDPVAGSELAEVLGADPLAAAGFAEALLARPQPLVSAGAGLWVRPHRETARLSKWRERLPDEVDTGDIPSEESLDRWVSDRTLGLIRRFPLTVKPEWVCLLASALATKVSWEVPFAVVGAAELGPHRWSGSLSRVLKTPSDPRHRQFLVDTPAAGPVAVHLASARGGLLVGSVIAADAAVPSGAVLAEAERIVTAEAARPGRTKRLSLFDLPLGKGPVWDLFEEADAPAGSLETGERFTSVLPAWSSRTELDLGARPELGFEAAAAAIGRALELEKWDFDAGQSAVARYSAVGFEAAAVTALALAVAARMGPRNTPRRAVVHFRHPYGVVAASANDPREPSPAAWHGLPVFSAWVGEAEDA